MAKTSTDEFDKKEAQARFEAALKGAMSTPHKPLKKKKAAKKPARKAKARKPTAD